MPKARSGVLSSIAGMSRSRPLRSDERAFLAREFGQSLPLDRVRIAGGGHPLGRTAWQPMAALIQFADVCFEAGDRDRSVAHAALPIFAHEALHVWQRVHGQCAVHVSVDGVWLGIARGGRAYNYDETLTDPAAMLAEFLAGNIERQGQMFEDYVRTNVHFVDGRDAKFAEIARYVRGRRIGEAGDGVAERVR